jgi:hypothetical protein
MLSGDPVAAGEVIAAPSAGRLAGCAVCPLDVNPRTQAARLAARGDDPARLPHHQAFAEWMRAHARDPQHMAQVLSGNGWEAMRWDRLGGMSPGRGEWSMHVVDTTGLSPEQVAGRVSTWCRRVLAGEAPVMHPRCQ